ncbi:MAG: hypothetical protein AAFU70_12825, partial [Planctomycetota bacterium]
MNSTIFGDFVRSPSTTATPKGASTMFSESPVSSAATASAVSISKATQTTPSPIPPRRKALARASTEAPS